MPRGRAAGEDRGMRPAAVVVLHVTVVALAVGLRLSVGGWLVLFAVLLGVPVLLAAQLALAAATARRGPAPAAVAVPSVLTAQLLLLGALLVPDGGDTPESIRSPLGLLLGTGRVVWAEEPGWWALLGYLVALVWWAVAVAVAVAVRRRRVPPAPPAPPARWSGSWPVATSPVGVISPVHPQPVHEQ
jgi:lysylphosphatidylglycerol synthetase-like protein (DUF2156 family)